MIGRFARRLASHAPAAAALKDSTSTALSILPNGLRVATQPHGHNGALAHVCVSLQSGTRNESRETSGTAHFLEHMAFKGTTTRPQWQFEKDIERIGGQMAAYTSREVTQFSITVPKHKLDEGVHVLCDMIMNPSLEPAAIEAERETISQEARHVERSYPEERIFDLLHSVAFERQPLGNDILGEGANYRNITRDDMAKFRATHYVAPKIVLSSAGAVDHAKMVELASKHFSSLPSQPAVAPAPLAPAVWHGGEIRVHNDDLEHITAAIAFQGPGVAHTDSIAMMAIQALFTSYKANQVGAKDVANKMAQAARREGVAAHINCHSVDTFYVPYTDVSMIGFHFKADPHAVDELTYSLLTELVTTCFIVSDTDLARAKVTLKYNFASASDGAIRAADDVGKQLLYFGRRITPEEFAAKVDALTADDIKTVAGKYIYDRDPAVVVMGPQLEQFPDYNWVRSWTYWLTQ